MADLNAQTRVPLGWAAALAVAILGFFGDKVLAHDKRLNDIEKRVQLVEAAVVTLKDIHLELLRQRRQGERE